MQAVLFRPFPKCPLSQPSLLCLVQTQNLWAISFILSLIQATLNTSLILPVLHHSPHLSLSPILLPLRKSIYVQLVIVLSPLAAI